MTVAKPVNDLWKQIRKALATEDGWDAPGVRDLLDRRELEKEAELPHPVCCDLARKWIYAHDPNFIEQFERFKCASGHNPFEHLLCPGCDDLLQEPYTNCVCGWEGWEETTP